jgi:chromosome partitioning protein
MIVVVGNEKGGVGKTTIAVNLAAMCALAGKEVLLVDTDKQESSSTWAAARGAHRAGLDLAPDLVCVAKTGKVGYDIGQFHDKFEVVIVDAGGRDSVEMRQAIVVCDLLVIPVRPSQFDTWSFSTMGDMVRAIRNQTGEEMPAKVIINGSNPNPAVRETDEVRKILTDDYRDEFDFVAGEIRDRIAFRKAARDGLSVVELTGKAADANATREIANFYKEIFNEEWQPRAKKPSAGSRQSRQT